MAVFCRWYEKEMENLTEHEQEQCAENGQDCCDCPELSVDRGHRMKLSEFREMGGCVGCKFHQNVEIEFERKECTFPWFDESAEEWGHEKNCDKMEEWSC